MTPTTIRIGPYNVGPDFPPFIIAELSANHAGRLERAMEIVHAAADNGAHAIKLQTFTAATLSIDSSRPEFFIDDPESLWHGRRLWELYEEAHTPWEWHAPLFDAARERGLACISSAFDQSSLDFLVQLGADAIKIASFELVHVPLIEAAARTGLPVIVSTGMGSVEEIDDAVAALQRGDASDFTLLKCTSAYPAKEDDANVLTIPDLQARYDCPVGISDHTLGPYAAYGAVALGATMIEKHLTIARDDGALDSAFSMEPAHLKELAEGTRRVWLSRGSVTYGTGVSEETSRKERPSIYAVKAIAAGEALTEENLRVIRPGAGLAPKHFSELIGRRASQDIPAETPMAWSLVDQERSRTGNE
jgi:N-acetylneuraminate synthase